MTVSKGYVCLYRPHRTEPRVYSGADLTRIMRIVCEREGPQRVIEALKEAQYPTWRHDGCPAMQLHCNDCKREVLEQELGALSWVFAAIGILVPLAEILSSTAAFANLLTREVATAARYAGIQLEGELFSAARIDALVNEMKQAQSVAVKYLSN